MFKLNFINKTLDALSGGDDKIFVIIDDRDDVWLNKGRQSQNLLKIPAYYYHNERESKPKWFELMIKQCWQAYDLDITLLVFLKYLETIHT